MNTIEDMQNEMYFYGHYNEIEYNHDFCKIDETLLHIFKYVFIC